MRTLAPSEARRTPTNVSLPETLVAEARALEVNVSRAAEAGLHAAVVAARNARWKAENRALIQEWNAWVEKHGLPLEQGRVW